MDFLVFKAFRLRQMYSPHTILVLETQEGKHTFKNKKKSLLL